MGMAPPLGQLRRENDTDRQAGRGHATSGISNSLTGNASNCKELGWPEKKEEMNPFPEPCVGLGLSASWSDVNQEDPGLQCAKEVCDE